MVVLVWPDPTQPEDAVRTQLTALAADRDVLIARWDPAADDGGRADLLTSVRDARERIASDGGDPDELALVGLGWGGVAAAGLTRYAKRLGIGLGPVVVVAANWNEPDPFSGNPLGTVPERVELVDRADEASAAITCWRRR